MPTIINSEKLCGDYDKVSALARETGEPIYITANGEGDTVLINQHAYDHMLDKIRIAAVILKEERERLNGVPGYTPEEVFAETRRIIDEARG